MIYGVELRRRTSKAYITRNVQLPTLTKERAEKIGHRNVKAVRRLSSFTQTNVATLKYALQLQRLPEFNTDTTKPVIAQNQSSQEGEKYSW